MKITISSNSSSEEKPKTGLDETEILSSIESTPRSVLWRSSVSDWLSSAENFESICFFLCIEGSLTFSSLFNIQPRVQPFPFFHKRDNDRPDAAFRKYSLLQRSLPYSAAKVLSVQSVVFLDGEDDRPVVFVIFLHYLSLFSEETTPCSERVRLAPSLSRMNVSKALLLYVLLYFLRIQW